MSRPIPDHGTRARYLHRTLKCKCNDCRKANSTYIAEYRKRKRNRPRLLSTKEAPDA